MHLVLFGILPCVSELYLTFLLSVSGSQWNYLRSMRPKGSSVCHAMSLRSHVCVRVSVFVCDCKCIPCRSAAHQTFLTTVPLGCHFCTSGPRVSMCNNDYLHLNHKEQENPDNCNTQRKPLPPPPPISRPWWNMIAGFAQLSAALAKSRHT